MNKPKPNNNKQFRFVDLCAGIGGIGSGLAAAHWTPGAAFDLDRDAISVHQLAHGYGDVADVFQLTTDDIGPVDALVAGFPCQPFSSSGNRLGLDHKSGNVFEAIAGLIDKISPQIVMMENVQGLLSNTYGFTFANVLLSLTRLGYEVSWGLINGNWYGAPQDRRRIVMIGTRPSNSIELISDSNNRFFRLNDTAVVRTVLDDSEAPNIVGIFDLERTVGNLAPAIGKPIPTIRTPFLTAGVAKSGHFATWKREVRPSIDQPSVGSIVCPEFQHASSVRSVRYWGHSGTTRPYFKKDPWAHCIGTNIGAAPTFACEKSLVSSSSDMDALLRNANWTRDEAKHVIFRINPEVACRLFGSGMDAIEAAFRDCRIGSTKKYVLLGNSVIPEQFRQIALKTSAHYNMLFK
jgi:hypothetical protein